MASFRLVITWVLLFLCIPLVHALPTVPGQGWFAGSGGPFPDAMSACLHVYPGTVEVMSYGTYADCAYRRWDGVLLVSGYRATLKAAQVCPANSSLSGSTCSCNSGFNEVSGSCVVYDPDAELNEYCSQYSGNKRDASVYQPGRGDAGPNIGFTGTCRVPEAYDPGGGDSGIPLFPGTNKGCGAAFEYDWAGSDGSGNWTVYGRETYNGSICTPGASSDPDPGTPPGDPDTPPSKEPDKSCNGYQGTINGVSTCVPYSEKSGTDGTSKKTNPDGSSEETSSTTKCTGTKCETTTTTTTKDSNGNVTGVTVNVGDSSKNVYCDKNPKASICSGESDLGAGEFGGSCSTGFTCKGDIVQCVIAKEQHRRACQLIDDANDETRLYDSSKGKEGDQTTALPGNRVLNMGAPGMFKTDAIFGTGSCIPDLSIQVMSRTVELPLSYLCPWVAELRYVLLGLSALYWVMIVFGRR